MNRYQILNIIGEEMTSSGMEVDWAEGTQTEDNTTPHAKQIINHPSWNTDTNIASLSTDLFQQLKQCQQMAQDAGELKQSTPTYEQPTQAIKMTSAISQRIRFNLIRHRVQSPTNQHCHNLCKEAQPPPGFNYLLGLGLNFCQCTQTLTAPKVSKLYQTGSKNTTKKLHPIFPPHSSSKY